MITSQLLSFVIPLYNEEDNVAPLLKGIDTAMKGYTYEIILVDDCSSDQTRMRIKEHNHPNVTCVELRKNYGQSMALAAGFDVAKGTYIITMDGDLQNDPEDVLPMLRLLMEEDWDIVTGIRQKRKDRFVRTIPSKFANAIIRRTTKLNLKDQGCALKVFTQETAQSLNLYGEMHRFINVVAHLDGARIKEVPVKHHARIHGKSKYGLGRTFKVINDLILLLFQRKYLQKPMHLFGNIGLVLFFIGMVINLYFAIVKAMGQDIWGRPLLILGVILTVVGVQFFTLGIVTDLLMRTYFESQQKRPYRIRRITKSSSEMDASSVRELKNIR